MEFTFRSIGVLVTPYKSKSGVPIQGVFDPESRGRAKVFKEYVAALQ